VGERRPGRDQERRLTLAEAAEVLGTSRDAVRMRVRRGSLRSELGEDGKRYVYIDPDRDAVRPEAEGEGSSGRAELVEELRERVNSLERRLDEEQESRRRADTIIAQLTQSNTSLIERLRELEAPSAQSPPAPEGAVEEGRKEIARRLVGGVFGLVVFIPSVITSVISYFNDAPTATIISAVLALFGILIVLIAMALIYFGVKRASDTTESAHRLAAEANAAAERAAQETAQGGPRADG